MFDLSGTTGSMDRRNDSTHVVNLWYVPNGTDYHRAKVVNVFFSKLDEAFTFGNKYSMPPEMAMVQPIADHDKTLLALEEKKKLERCPSFDYEEGRNDAENGVACDMNRSEAYLNGFNDFRRDKVEDKSKYGSWDPYDWRMGGQGAYQV